MTWWQTWRQARELNWRISQGEALIAVPDYLVSEVRGWLWSKEVDQAAEKWAAQEQEMTLSEWRAVVLARAGVQRPPYTTLWDRLEDQHGPYCGECGRPWRQDSPYCPHRINNVHPLADLRKPVPK